MEKPKDFVKAIEHEAIKQHMEYDGSDRVEEIYTALYGTKDGESCIKMTYAYDGSSERITDMKEELAEWDGDWDF